MQALSPHSERDLFFGIAGDVPARAGDNSRFNDEGVQSFTAHADSTSRSGENMGSPRGRVGTKRFRGAISSSIGLGCRV